ncbi:U3 small nucleolar ribonucleoprotein MPP10 [Stigmatopora argus]
MAELDASNTLQTCLDKLHANTEHPDNFLSLQDAVATDFKLFTKALYDLHKAQEPAHYKASPLFQLVVENFDEEQIWQELELQNSGVLRHFRSSVDEALSDETFAILQEEEEMDEGTGDEEGDINENIAEEAKDRPRGRFKKMPEYGGEKDTDEDSDLDFDVDALEKSEKQKRKPTENLSKMKGIPSEVDDQFFKLSEMESFLNDMDKKEAKEQGDENAVDYFQDMPSDEDDNFDLELISKKKLKKKSEKSTRDLKYKDYFSAGEGTDGDADEQLDSEDEEKDGEEEVDDDDEEVEEEEEEEDFDNDVDNDNKSLSTSQKTVTFNLPGIEESEGEEFEDIFGGKGQNSNKSQSKSSYEKNQEKMSQKIEEFEKASLSTKSWQLSGEVTAQSRPENSMLEEDLEYEQASRKAPAITEETTLQLEDIIKQRIKDQAFDDVVRKEKPKEEVFEYKKRLTLDHEKSKKSLAEIYEQEYIKQAEQKTEEEENPAHVEIQKLMDALFLKLDALSNFHFTPKPAVPEVKVVSNLPSITIEEVTPATATDATLLAPEEIKEKNKAGDILGDTEKTSTDKKRERRLKKKVKHFKIKDKEKQRKLKEAIRASENKMPSKAQVKEDLKKLTKGGKATILKDEGKDKALRSSQAFFSQLQDQVKSQIKNTKSQPTKKKKKEVSASKLKL